MKINPLWSKIGKERYPTISHRYPTPNPQEIHEISTGLSTI